MEHWRIYVKQEYKLIDVVAHITGTRKKAKKLIDEGLVSVFGKRELRYRKTLKPGSVVEFCLNPLLFKPERPEVLYRENGVWVFNKPLFLNSNRDKPNLEEVIKKVHGKEVKVVHRLDKQTSGAIIAVENKKLFEKFKEIFRKREIEKEYLTVVSSIPKWSRKRVDFRLDGKEAVTELSVLERFERGALLLAKIPTGRKHQIRRHLAGIGFPVAGEFIYWKRAFPFPFNFSPRILLHSYRIGFKHPETGKKVRIEAPLPEDFRSFLNSLREFKFKVNELTL